MIANPVTDPFTALPDSTGPATLVRFDILTRLANRYFGVRSAFVKLAEQAGPANSPLVPDEPAIGFYAESPLVAPDGKAIGAFCLMDDVPGELTPEQHEFLRDLARLAADIVECDKAQARARADEQGLRESEARMALALEGSGTGIWDRDARTGEIHYSTGWKAMLGYTEAEVTNRIEDSYARVHPDDLAYVQSTIQKHFKGNTSAYEVEHRLLCKDGSYKWVSSRGKVVSRDSDGSPIRMIGTTTDITVMRTMSEKLQQTVDLITNLTNEVPGLVFQLRMMPDGQCFFPYASTGISDVYELTYEQVARTAGAIDAVIHSEDLASYHASLAASATNLASWHLQYRVRLARQGLRWRQVDAHPKRLEDGSTLWHGLIIDVTARKHIEAELREFATMDALTQVANRRHFMVQIEELQQRIQSQVEQSCAVLMLDVDHFKAINDTWGHAAGDRALQHLAAILRSEVRPDDILGRVGGEEFAVVLADAGLEDAIAFATCVQKRIAACPLEGEQAIAYTISVGAAVMSASDANADASLYRSDMALYRAKQNGRNRIEVFATTQGASAAF